MIPGKFQNAADGYLHCKYAPCTIIALATVGQYAVRTPQGAVVAATGEAFLASEGQWLEITHRAAERGGRMQAIWLHARFSLFRTVDLVSLLKLPAKTDRVMGQRLAAVILALLELSAAGAGETGEAAGARVVVNGQAGRAEVEADAEVTIGKLARRQALGFQALALLCEVAPLSTAGEAFLMQADRLAPVLAYIRSHLKQAIGVEALAAAAGLSRSQFHRFFQEQLGRTPMEYVKRQRLNEARLLLIGTRQPVYAIAEETGFANAFHFSREFKKQYGEAPKGYRRLHAGMQV